MVRLTLLGAMLVTGLQAAAYTIMAWLPTLMVSERGLKPGPVIFTMLIMCAGAFAGFVVTSWLADRYGRRPALLLFSIGAWIFTVIYMMVPMSTTLLMAMAFPVGAFATGIFAVLGPFLSELFPTHVRTTCMGFSYNLGKSSARCPSPVSVYSPSASAWPSRSAPSAWSPTPCRSPPCCCCRKPAACAWKTSMPRCSVMATMPMPRSTANSARARSDPEQESVMLYCVKMDVNIPRDIPADKIDAIKAAEKALAIELQQAGKWPHLWRVVGQYSNISIFDVESNDELHTLLSSLPLFPFMTIQVTPLAKHPSSIV